MNSFAARLCPDGRLEPASAAGTCRPETHAECQVFFCGYIAQRKALRERLGLAAQQRSSDAETLAYAYRKWGHELQANVLGEYAVFVFDRQNRTGLLTHDALGVAPLFYAAQPAGLAFASQLLGLLTPAACDALDHEHIADYLISGHVISDRTPYRSIQRLLPGMSLEWRDGRVRHLRTWDLARVPPLRCADNREYEEQFRDLLTAGVRAALDDSGTTWVSLSGGLDSSSIACVAAKEKTQELAAFSVVCPGWPEADEECWMRSVIDHAGLAWHPVDVETVLPFSRLPDQFLCEPTGAVTDSEYRKVTNELFASHGVRTMLSGDGGDSVLCAHPGPIPAHLADPLFSGELIETFRALAAWRAGVSEKRSWPYWLVRALFNPAINHIRGMEICTAPPLPLSPWIASNYASKMQLAGRRRLRAATRCDNPGRQHLWDLLWMSSLSQSTAPPGLMSYQLRKPLLYRPLVEFMCAIPWEQKLRPRCDRYLQRRALKGVLPEPVRRRAGKASGNRLLSEGLRRSKDWIEYLCETPVMAELGIADADQWRQSVRQASIGQTHGDCFFMAGVAIEAWLKGLAAWRATTSGVEQRPPAQAVAV